MSFESLKVCFFFRKDRFDSAVSPSSIEGPIQQNDLSRLAETFSLPIEAPSLYADAIIYDAVDNTRATIHAQIFDDTYFSIPPIQGFCWAGFDAEFTFKALASSVIDSYASTVKELSNAERLEKLLSSPSFLFLRFFKKKPKHVSLGGSFSFRQFNCSSFLKTRDRESFIVI